MTHDDLADICDARPDLLETASYVHYLAEQAIVGTGSHGYGEDYADLDRMVGLFSAFAEEFGESHIDDLKVRSAI